MNSGNGDKDGRPPADDEDRGVLFGWSKDGGKPARGGERRPRPPANASSEEPRAAPPEAEADPGSQSAPTHDEDAPDLARAVSELVAVQRRLEAQLAARNAALGEIAATLPDLHASAGKIDTATEWANNIKAGTERLLEINSKLIEGLEGGRGDLDKTIAEIRIQKDSLGEQLTSFDKGVQELRDLWKVVDQRTRALETAEKELAGHYKNWTVGGTDFRRDINALSERLGKGDEIVSQIGRAQDAWTDKASKVLEADAEAHRLASGQVSSDVDKLREAGQDFMEELRKYRAATDKDIRKKQNWIRRWAVPALFLLVMPSLGALGQSELGFFEAHDDTGGSKQFVWDNHGDRVRECMLASKRTRSVIKCTFNVRYP